MKKLFLLLIFSLNSTSTTHIKYIDPQIEQNVIAYSHTEKRGQWVYRKAKLSYGYFFAVESTNVRLKQIVAKETLLSRFQKQIPLGTDIMFTDRDECHNCQQRGKVGHYRGNGYFEIIGSVCSIARNSLTMVTSNTTYRHVSEIRKYVVEPQDVWRERICNEKSIGAQVAFRISNHCNRYKIGFLTYRPKVKIEFKEGLYEDTGETYFIGITGSEAEMTPDIKPDISSIKNDQLVIVKVNGKWLAGHYQSKAVKLKGNSPNLLKITDTTELRILDAQVLPFCKESNSTVVIIKPIEPTNSTSTVSDISQGNLATILIILGITAMVSILFGIIIYIFVIYLKSYKKRKRRQISLGESLPSCGVRESFACDLSQSFEAGAESTTQENNQYDSPNIKSREQNLYMVTRLSGNSTEPYAEVNIVDRSLTMQEKSDDGKVYDRLTRRNMDSAQRQTSTNNYDKVEQSPIYFDLEGPEN